MTEPTLKNMLAHFVALQARIAKLEARVSVLETAPPPQPDAELEQRIAALESAPQQDFAAALEAHLKAPDPHGDRAYADRPAP